MTNEDLKKLLEMHGMSEEEFMRRYEAAIRAREEAQAQRVQAARWAAARQVAINELQPRQYAVIVAVDAQGGFTKNNEIPWHYPEDLKWFKKNTLNHICVMGRLTYDDINRRQGDDGADVLLPERKSFVLSTSNDTLQNATSVRGVAEIETHLNDDDTNKTIFFIGGGRVFQEGLGMADTVYMTVVNDTFNCDKFFPVEYITDNFIVDKMYETKAVPELRFIVWKRKVA